MAESGKGRAQRVVGFLRGLFGARASRFETPRELVDPAEAPALYAMVEALAGASVTEIYLTGEARVNVFVGERALGIGAPLLATTTLSDLRALTATALGGNALAPADVLERAAAVASFYEVFARRDVPSALAAGLVPSDIATTLAKHFAVTPPAAAIVDIDLDAFLVSEVLERASLSRHAVKPATSEEILRDVLAPSIATRAALVMERLAPRFPAQATLVDLFVAVADSGEPDADLAALLSGALLESGAQIAGWLGLPHPVFAWRGLEVVPELIDRGALVLWARELAEAPAASGIVKSKTRPAISAAS